MRRFTAARYLKFSSIFLILVLGISFILVTHQASASVAPWDPNSHAYVVGDQVSYQSNIYQCIQPHTSQAGWDPASVPALWKLIGPAGANPTNTPPVVPTSTKVAATPTRAAPTNTPKPGATNTPLPVATNTPKPGPTNTPKPVATNTPKPAATNTPMPQATNTPMPQPTNTPTSGGSAAPWDPNNHPYALGDLVSYQGNIYKCTYAHSSNSSWTPTAATTLWQLVGPAGPTPTPGPTNTPAPTATTGPTATPCSSCGGGVPHRVFVGYWHNFDNGTGFIPLTSVPSYYNVIEVSFGLPAGGGTMKFTPYNETPSQFAADIATMHSRGKKVLLSFSGYNDPFSITDAGMAANFTSSVTAIIKQYGFDGIDIDMEQQSVYLQAGDTDVTHPTSPAVVYLIQGIRGVANNIGSSFMLTLAPETMYVQTGLSHYGPNNGSDARSGDYLPIIYALRDIISWVQTQDYNSGAIMGPDGQYHNMGSVDFHVTMTEMLLKGFKIPGGNSTFPGLRDDQVVIGTPAGAQAGQGFMDAASVGQAMSQVMSDGYPNLRGVMTWSINWDVYYSNTYGNGIRSYLDAHP